MIKKTALSAVPTFNSENNRFSLCPDSYFAKGTIPELNFARQRIVPIPTLRRTYTLI